MPPEKKSDYPDRGVDSFMPLEIHKPIHLYLVHIIVWHVFLLPDILLVLLVVYKQGRKEDNDIEKCKSKWN